MFFSFVFFCFVVMLSVGMSADAAEGLSLFSSFQAGVSAQRVGSLFQRPPRCYDVQVSPTQLY